MTRDELIKSVVYNPDLTDNSWTDAGASSTPSPDSEAGGLIGNSGILGGLERVRDNFAYTTGGALFGAEFLPEGVRDYGREMMHNATMRMSQLPETAPVPTSGSFKDWASYITDIDRGAFAQGANVAGSAGAMLIPTAATMFAGGKLLKGAAQAYKPLSAFIKANPNTSQTFFDFLAGTAGAPIEATVEKGAQIDELMNMGYSREDATRLANEVKDENLALLGMTNGMETALGMNILRKIVPIGSEVGDLVTGTAKSTSQLERMAKLARDAKTPAGRLKNIAKGAGAIGGSTALNAYEEGVQNEIQQAYTPVRNADGSFTMPENNGFTSRLNPFNWSDESWEAAKEGGVGAGVLALTGKGVGAGRSAIFGNRADNNNNDNNEQQLSDNGIPLYDTQAYNILGEVSDSNATEDTLNRLNALAHAYQNEFGEQLNVTSLRRHGDGTSWHDSGQAFDLVSNGLEANENGEREWLIAKGKELGLAGLDEYAHPSAGATGGHIHFSNHGEDAQQEEDTFDNFMAKIGMQESGGNYNAVNSDTGASGKYQIMPNNWSAWAEEAGLDPNSEMTPENQEIVARAKLKQYYDKYGAKGALVAWYAGPSNAERYVNGEETDIWGHKWTDPQSNGPSIQDYVDQSLAQNGGKGTKSAPASRSSDEADKTPDLEDYLKLFNTENNESLGYNDYLNLIKEADDRTVLDNAKKEMSQLAENKDMEGYDSFSEMVNNGDVEGLRNVAMEQAERKFGTAENVETNTTTEADKFTPFDWKNFASSIEGMTNFLNNGTPEQRQLAQSALATNAPLFIQNELARLNGLNTASPITQEEQNRVNTILNSPQVNNDIKSELAGYANSGNTAGVRQLLSQLPTDIKSQAETSQYTPEQLEAMDNMRRETEARLNDLGTFKANGENAQRIAQAQAPRMSNAPLTMEEQNHMGNVLNSPQVSDRIKNELVGAFNRGDMAGVRNVISGMPAVQTQAEIHQTSMEGLRLAINKAMADAEAFLATLDDVEREFMELLEATNHETGRVFKDIISNLTGRSGRLAGQIKKAEANGNQELADKLRTDKEEIDNAIEALNEIRGKAEIFESKKGLQSSYSRTLYSRDRTIWSKKTPSKETIEKFKNLGLRLKARLKQSGVPINEQVVENKLNDNDINKVREAYTRLKSIAQGYRIPTADIEQMGSIDELDERVRNEVQNIVNGNDDTETKVMKLEALKESVREYANEYAFEDEKKVAKDIISVIDTQIGIVNPVERPSNISEETRQRIKAEGENENSEDIEEDIYAEMNNALAQEREISKNKQKKTSKKALASQEAQQEVVSEVQRETPSEQIENGSDKASEPSQNKENTKKAGKKKKAKKNTKLSANISPKRLARSEKFTKREQLNLVKTEFPTAKNIKQTGNSISFTLNGERCRVDFVDKIVVTENEKESYRRDYGREYTDDVAILGKTDTISGEHIITLLNHGEKDTISHEAFHLAFRTVLTKAQQDFLLREYGDEEGVAEAYRKLMNKSNARGTMFDMSSKIGRLFQKIWNFANSLFNVLDKGSLLQDSNALLYAIADGSLYDINEGNTGVKAILHPKYLAAWHGSGETFDKFNLDYNGTGEGPNAHGWGLYFALTKATSEGYADRLKKLKDFSFSFKDAFGHTAIFEWNSKKEKLIAKTKFKDGTFSKGSELNKDDYEFEPYYDFIKALVDNKGDMAGVIEDLEQYAEDDPPYKGYSRELLDNLRENKVTLNGYENPQGILYSVDIPSTSEMLREDDKIAIQPKKIVDAVKSAIKSVFPDVNNPIGKSYIIHEVSRANASDEAKELYKKQGEAEGAIKRFENELKWFKTGATSKREVIEKYSLAKDAISENEDFSGVDLDDFDSIIRAFDERERNKKPLSEEAINSVSDATIEEFFNDRISSWQEELKEIEEKLKPYKFNDFDSWWKIAGENMTGRQLYDILSRLTTPKDASMKLLEGGVQGISYNGFEDGECCVVFNDQAVKILERNGEPVSQPTNTKLMAFVGEKAIEPAPYQSLNKAKQMEASGKSAEEIYKATEWFKGKDNKWRYEIPDNLEDIDLSKLSENAVKLDDVYDNYKLFNAYPQLKDVKVEVGNLEGSTVGTFNPINNIITLDKEALENNPIEAKKTIVHELQHAIQDIEGFAKGTTERMALTTFNIEREKLLQELFGSKFDATQLAKRWKKLNDLLNKKKLNSKDKEVLDNLLQGKTPSEMKDTIDRLTNLTKAREAIQGLSDRKQKEYLYENSAGEQESRMVESRAEKPYIMEHFDKRLKNASEEEKDFLKRWVANPQDKSLVKELYAKKYTDVWLAYAYKKKAESKAIPEIHDENAVVLLEDKMPRSNTKLRAVSKVQQSSDNSLDGGNQLGDNVVKGNNTKLMAKPFTMKEKDKRASVGFKNQLDENGEETYIENVLGEEDKTEIFDDISEQFNHAVASLQSRGVDDKEINARLLEYNSDELGRIISDYKAIYNYINNHKTGDFEFMKDRVRSIATENGKHPEDMPQTKEDIERAFETFKDYFGRRLDYAKFCYNELALYREAFAQTGRKISSWRMLEESRSERIKADKQARLRGEKGQVNNNPQGQPNNQAGSSIGKTSLRAVTTTPETANTKLSARKSASETLIDKAKQIFNNFMDNRETYVDKRTLTKRLEELSGLKVKWGRVTTEDKVILDSLTGVIRAKTRYDFDNLVPKMGNAICKKLGLEENNEAMNAYISSWLLTGYSDNSLIGQKFTKAMKDNPVFASKLTDVRLSFAQWNSLDADVQQDRSMRDNDRPTRQEKVQSWKEKLHDQFIEELGPVERMVQEIEKKTGKKLKKSLNPYVAFRMFRGHYGKAMVMVEGKTNEAIKALKTIFPSVTSWSKFKSLQMIFDEVGVKDHDSIRKFALYCAAKHFKDINLHNKEVQAKIDEVQPLIDKYDKAKATITEYNKAVKDGDTAKADSLKEKFKEAQEFKKDNAEAYEKAKSVAEHNHIITVPAEWAEDKCDYTINKYDSEKFQKGQKDIVQYSKTLTELCRDAGLMSAEQYEKIVGRWDNYVPLHRSFNENENVWGDSTKHMKGSAENIINPFETLVHNTFEFMKMAERNKSKKLLADIAKMSDLGAIIEEVPAGSGLENTISYYDDGVKKYLEADPMVVRAVNNMGMSATSAYAKFFKTIASVARACFTSLNPAFAIRNTIRDTQDAMIYNRGLLPKDILRGFVEAVKHGRATFGKGSDSEAYYEWLASGAAQASAVSLDRHYSEATIKKMTKSWNWKNPIDLGNMLLNYLQAFSEYSEYGTRIGTYEAVKKRYARENKDATNAAIILEGAYASRDNMDFARGGKSSRDWNNWAIFANASIQGWDKFYRALMKGDKASRRHVITGLAMSMLATACLGLMFDYDDEWYKELPDFQKQNFWIMRFGDTIVRIPKGQDVGLRFLTNCVDKMIGTTMRGEHNTANSFVKPLEDLLPSIAPTAMMPVMEAVANYSWFRDAPIVPAYQSKLPAYLQYGPQTSGGAKAISSLTKFFGMDTGVSPRKVDHLIYGYSGAVGSSISQIAGLMYDGAYGEGLSIDYTDVANMPVLSGVTADIMKNPVSVQRFYEEYDKQSRYHMEYSQTKKKPDGYDQARYKKLNSANSIISKLNKQERELLVNPKISPEEKSQKVKAINEKRAKIAQKILGE